MKTSTSRLMELALKGLELEKEKIDAEIAELRKKLRGTSRSSRSSAKKNRGQKRKRQLTISAEESKRRSERMKKYWANFRKKKAAASRSRTRSKKN